MKAVNIPAKFPIPFANNAGGAYIRPVPEASQVGVTPGAASLYDGFPPLTFQPESAGGIPPAGQDFNGLLNLITAWIRWISASGPIKYDAAFATKIGGYPDGAMLLSSAGDFWWLNTADDNTTNPDGASPVGWLKVIPPVPSAANPLANGTASPGNLDNFSRGNHVHPTDTTRAALSYVNATFLTIAAAAATYLTQANPTSSGQLTHNGNASINGQLTTRDIVAHRNNSSGVIFLGNTGQRYLFFDGTNYIMPGTQLFVNGGLALTNLTLADFTEFGSRSIDYNGFQRFPGGLLMQWGTAPGGTGTFNFPTAFTFLCFCILPTWGGGNHSGDDNVISGVPISTTQFSLFRSGGANTPASWVAFGA